ncbi:hypothetical protein E4U49_001661 [Claviceps purpurea]|nr:hypothetical protein E4U49_001661 [Claviceps purpurea]
MPVMATHSMATAGRVVRYDDCSSTPFPHRPQPGSPTLTNPDMILPDYDEPLEGLSHSSSTMWNDAQHLDAFNDFTSTGYKSGPPHPTTPIIYGNGTMLSDIGEVTEVESTVGYDASRSSPRLAGTNPGTRGSSTALRSSPTTGKKTLKKRPQITNRERRLSIESTSTTQTIDVPDGAFGDLDDSISVHDDTSFHGDDEESIASEFVDEKSRPMRSARAMPSDRALDEDRSSTKYISKRAEQILANAKRRLTAMEGNLNRARTFSYSSLSEGSTPSPNGGRSNGLAKSKSKPASPNHSRNVSDNGLQGALRLNMLPQRSASALGAAGGYRQHLPMSRSADGLATKNSLGAMRSPLSSMDSTLEPLDEIEDAEGEMQGRSNSRLQGLGSPTLGAYADVGMTRSASAAQVRDLHDQMQGLKGKISSLREQAKQDSMKRRSMQNLRALSPFTNAPYEPGLSGSKQNASAGSGNPAPSRQLNGTMSTPDNLKLGFQQVEKEQRPYASKEKQTGLKNAGPFQETRNAQAAGSRHDSQAANGAAKYLQEQYRHDNLHAKELSPESQTDDKATQDAETLEDTFSESGESLYHDTYQESGDISHEDREDAFDYEHIFLHSAMGAISRQGMTRTDSVSSVSSEDSIETTRGPVITMTQARRPSVDTMTSIESFATAREHGVESRSATAQSSRLDHDLYMPTAQREDDESSTATKRSTFGCLRLENGSSSNGTSSGSGSGSGSGSDPRAYSQNHTRHSSLVHRPVGSSTQTILHRPSFSSFESTGTNRSFPLVNKMRLSGGVFTPNGSPDYKLKQVAESLMNETASIRDKDSVGSGPNSPALQALSREDQLLVEQVVASLGRCVLGLSEAARLGTGDQDHYRRRIEAAKKLLENVSD